MRILVAAVAAAAGVGAANLTIADAAMQKDSTAVKAMIAQKVDVNAPQADGTTALHWAVREEDGALVDLLLKAGANPNAQNRDGATPLYLAAENGSVAM